MSDADTYSDGVVSVAGSDEEQLRQFQAMEADAVPYVLNYTERRHRHEFSRADVLYKSIYDDTDNLVGFIILALDPDGRSVELVRIVVSKRGKSYGTRAMALIEQVCSDELGRGRVWLDVFEFNHRGCHVYEKSGYRLFGTTELDGKVLRLYEKDICPA